jgi:HlyD family secretion protein
MIKNAVVPAAAFVALALLGACGGHAKPSGYQGIVELQERVVAFEVTGRIEGVAVRRGDRVRREDVLATVDPTLTKLTRDARADEARAAAAELALLEAGTRKEDVSSSAAEVRATEATEDLLRKTRDRAQALRREEAIPQAELDRAEADLERAKSERQAGAERLAALKNGARREDLARARARAEAANAAFALEAARLERYTVRAGVDGTVLDVHVEPGELATSGRPLATIADTSHPYVEVFVPEGEMGGIAVGKKASVTIDTGATAPGIVEYVASRTEFTPKFIFSERERPNVMVRVRIRIDDPDARMHAGVPAFAKVER